MTMIDLITLLTNSAITNQVDENSNIRVDFDGSKQLTYIEKRHYYELGRAPILMLHKELENIKIEIEKLSTNEDSQEYIEKCKQRKKIELDLRKARHNAANDIYERVNSRGNMGYLNEEEGLVFIDLHGLHLKEAIHKLEEIILPVIFTLSRVNLITGYGLHATNQESVLKNGLREFLNRKKNLKCENDPKNKGILCVYEKSKILSR